MQLRVTLSRGELVRQGAQNLEAEVPQVGRRQIRTVMDRIKRRMEAYPAERPGQSKTGSHPILGTTYTAVRYKRTGKLGRSWRIEKAGNSGYIIRNDARDKRRRAYGRYVVGDAYGTGQAWMHRGRWQVLRDVADEEVAKLPPAVEREIEMVARRAGL